jgi:hypothetical protein
MKSAENFEQSFTILIPSVEEDIPPVWSTTLFLFEQFNAMSHIQHTKSHRTPQNLPFYWHHEVMFSYSPLSLLSC